MYKLDPANYPESSYLSKVIYNPTGAAKTPKWTDKSDEPGKAFEIKTKELLLKFGPKVINHASLLIDLSETKAVQKKYDIDCLAVIEKPNLVESNKGFMLIVECKTTKTEKMRANHGFYNKIVANRSFINKRLKTIFKDKYIPIYILATEGFNYTPELKKKFLDEKIILMSEIESKYLEDCFLVSKNKDFTFNQFLTFFRSKSVFYDKLIVGAFETHTDFKQKKMAYTFSAPVKQMIQLTGVAHKVAKDIISPDEDRLLNSDHYQRILKKGRLSNLGKYLDREKKPFNNNILLSYRGTPKDFKFRVLDSVGQGRAGELTVSGKPGSFHVIDGQHRLFGYLAVNDPRLLDQTLICTVFYNLTQAEEAEIFLDINSNQKKVDIALRREVQLILGDSATGQDQVDNLATLIVLGLREEELSPFSKNPVSIPLPEQSGILQVEQLRKAILNGNLIARKKDFKKGRLTVDDNFERTVDFSIQLFINYFSRIREAVEVNGNFWRRQTKDDKAVALRTNFICGCILLLERFIEDASKGRDLSYKDIENSIKKYVDELIHGIANMTSTQRKVLYAWNKNGVDMEEGSGKFPSARAHLIHMLIPQRPELLYGNEKELYIDIQDNSNLDHVKSLIDNMDPNNIGQKALAFEQVLFRRLHKYLVCLFGEDYWHNIIETYFAEKVAQKVIKKKSDQATSEWVGLSPDFNDVSYKNMIDWCDLSEIREIFDGLSKDRKAVFQEKLRCQQPVNIKGLMKEMHFISTNPDISSAPQGPADGLKWINFLSEVRRGPSHPRDDSAYTDTQYKVFEYIEPKIYKMFKDMDKFMAKEEEEN
jgi:DGQHR domain-containing protein